VHGVGKKSAKGRHTKAPPPGGSPGRKNKPMGYANLAGKNFWPQPERRRTMGALDEVVAEVKRIRKRLEDLEAKVEKNPSEALKQELSEMKARLDSVTEKAEADSDFIDWDM